MPIFEVDTLRWHFWMQRALGEGTHDSDSLCLMRVPRAGSFCSPRWLANPTEVPLTSDSCNSHAWDLRPFLTMRQSCNPLLSHSAIMHPFIHIAAIPFVNYFDCNLIFSPQTNPIIEIFLLSPFYRKGNWNRERLSNLFKVTQLVSSKGFRPKRWVQLLLFISKL